jgi:hypothetical protein
MSNITYRFHEAGCIPGVPASAGGIGYIGMEIDVDDTTRAVSAVRHHVYAKLVHNAPQQSIKPIIKAYSPK